MKILLDVDGVVADMSRHLLDVLGSHIRYEDQVQWDLLTALPPDESDRARRILSTPEFWASIPLIDGAREGVENIRRLGHKIVWVTSPWDSCFGWTDIRRSWLNTHFGGDEPIIFTHDKELIDGDVLIDDKPDNIDKWQSKHPSGRALLYDAPYNRHHPAPRFSWQRYDQIGL